ncbi:hypothetical protein PAMC26577_02370 [Caballeronia sordidicola]|uniref:Uncharacterized protein n=1 Tax=Caballeronia sordidicola TaxID=196367 RepID=A0A242N6E0_CABSO|nr:hypothetical protein PAMC26577_02370 [Caballeronia sordidicola]
MSISKTLTKNAGRIAWTVCGSTRRETLETDALVCELRGGKTPDACVSFAG